MSGLSTRGPYAGAIAAVLLATGPVPAHSAEWRVFANGRFGFSVEVPATYRAAAPPDNGDGRRFDSPDGTVTVKAYGQYLVGGRGSLAADAAQALSSERQDGLTVTYRSVGRDRYTFSGRAGGRIVYVHAVATCGGDAVATIRIDYPEALKTNLDPLVARAAASLRGSGRCA